MAYTSGTINTTDMLWTECSLEDNSTNCELTYSQGNITNNTGYEPGRIVPDIPAYILITTTFFYVSIFLFGIIGNILIVYVVLCSRTMQSATHLFLVNLSLSDLLVLVICMPTALIDLYAKEVWFLGEAMCKSVPFFENCTALASTITIVMISCERYRGICQPVKTRTTKVLSRSQIGILIAVSWMSAIVACLPFFFIPIYKDSKFKDGTPIKVCRNTIKETENMIALGLEGYYNLLTFARLLFYLHCATNPIIYNAMSTKFRLATVKVFCTKKSYKKGMNEINDLFTKQFSSSLPLRESNQGIKSLDKNFPEAETTV
ncbi:QRFP-like peptide receptor [Lingula anatina]|uniref:QRFP-like peptide receptor n=1 Tax=Lingula anatina TaxID=7574 RepID=A0A2R2MSH0_LINAN|nr:QRFP-like peptide receptor [Lingula anatina]|eukprot:XP_023933194.1 QRFP-like peptide receptor [Lingula anatina]